MAETPKKIVENQTSALLVEVTPEMIEAGVAELREKVFGQPLEDVVQDVFWAMVSCAKFERVGHNLLMMGKGQPRDSGR